MKYKNYITLKIESNVKLSKKQLEQEARMASETMEESLNEGNEIISVSYRMEAKQNGKV